MKLTTEFTSSLPLYFQPYAVNLTNILRADLCGLSLNKNPLYVNVACKKVLGGIMTMGYPETVVFFNDLINKYSYNNMSQLGTISRLHAAYPVFMEVLYVRRALYNLITSLENDFMDRT